MSLELFWKVPRFLGDIKNIFSQNEKSFPKNKQKKIRCGQDSNLCG